MQSYVLASYILVWPVVSAAVLAMILGATIKDMRTARRENREFL